MIDIIGNILFNPLALLIVLLIAGLLGESMVVPRKAIKPLALVLLAGVIISFVVPPIGFSSIIVSFWIVFFYVLIDNKRDKKVL